MQVVNFNNDISVLSCILSASILAVFVYRTVLSSARTACMLNSCQDLHSQRREIRTEERKRDVNFIYF